MIMETSTFPQFLPIGEYRLDIRCVTHMNGEEEFVILTQDYYEIKPLGTEQF